MAPNDFVMTLESDEEDTPRLNPARTSKANADTDDLKINEEFNFDFTGDTYADLWVEQAGPSDVVKSGTKPLPISVDDIIARRKLNLKTKKRKREEASSSGESDDDEEDEDEEDDEESDGEGVQGSDESESESSDGLVGEDQDEEVNDPLASDDDDEGEESGEKGEISDKEGEFSDDSSEESEEETQAEKDKKAEYFESLDPSAPEDSPKSFLTMNLSRPIVKAVAALGFRKPTPIQAATIPVALLGKDVVGNAVTGSGKTAAFTIPMLERLLYRDKGKKAAATRCLVLVPTRELAVQCFEMGTKLAMHTDIRFCLIVGGLSLKSQEATLRSYPDIIVATPGRLIDHLRNSPSFTLDALDILVLDEADRMLSEGFESELTEIIRACPESRQTMLFSATSTDSIDELVRMSLKKPVRLFVDPKRSTARGLIQEFVRVRAGKEAERSAILAALCKRTFKSRVIIFFRSKKLAHQMRIVFGLLDMKCDELHGDLTQEQRLQSLQRFRDGTVDYLMATDLASRGLDIKGIDVVINYDMPGQLAQYLHRVGRTARAGKKGRSVTLIGEVDRKMLKAAIKHASGDDQVRHRLVPSDVIQQWSTKLDEMKDEISAILREEKEEKEIRRAEMELKKGQNMIQHQDEILSRPARTWFQTGKEKAQAEAISKQQYEAGFNAASSKSKKQAASDDKPKRDKFAGLSRRQKRRKMMMEDEDEQKDRGAINASIRSAKKSARPPKIGDPDTRASSKKSKSKSKKKAAGKASSQNGGRKGSSFDKDLGQKREGARAKKGDAIAGMGKKKGGKRKG